MPNERKKDRYAVRKDANGWTVFEVFSGEPARVGGAPQIGMSDADAQHQVGLLNARSHIGTLILTEQIIQNL